LTTDLPTLPTAPTTPWPASAPFEDVCEAVRSALARAALLPFEALRLRLPAELLPPPERAAEVRRGRAAEPLEALFV
jgi:hypothetical protein